ncbi:MAG: DUF5667 domain-containing protein [Anaerolineales bacterium]|nr:DUF5667 domain-containing protein [Anaerolineales bacterium]
MKDNMTDILAFCLEAIERGERTLEECLALYPEQRESLENLLSTAMSARAGAGYAPRPEFRQASRARLLKRLKPHKPVTFCQTLRHTRQNDHPVFVRRFAMSWLVILALVASLAGGGTVYASGEALPGDALYSVKLAVEDARLFLSDDAGDVTLHIEFLQTRRDEIQTLIVAGRGDDLPLAMETFSAGINEAAQALAAVAQDDPARAAALSVLLEQALSVHTQVLTVLLDIVPEEAKTAIEQAIIASSKGQEIVHGLFEDGIPGGPPGEIPAPPITPPVPTGLPGGVPSITPPVPTGFPGGAPPITPPVPTAGRGRP